jgi:peptidyl-prolyl cis-trans isomerase D
MLDIMRRKKRLKAILWVVIFSLALGMLLFFVPGVNIGSVARDTSAATVDGQVIPMNDFAAAYRRMVKQYSNRAKDRIDPETLKAMGLPKQVLDEMISEKVLQSIADGFGVTATENEVRRGIETFPYFQDQGKFIGIERYKALLAANDLSVDEFEKNMRSSQIANKVRAIVTDSLDVSDRELRDEFSRANQKTQVDYTILKKDDFRKRVKPVEAELRAYFEGHKASYQIKEKRRAQYLLVPISPIISSVNVTEQEILDEWNQKPREETADVSHILFKVDDKSKDAEVKAKAEKVLERAKNGEDFAELAKKYSQDTGNASQGGNLGLIRRGYRFKEFDDVAFSLKDGEISGLVRTRWGYHIIRTIKHIIPTLELNRSDLIAAIRYRKAKDIAKQKAEEAGQLAEKSKDLSSAAKNLGVETTIKETGLFQKDDVLKEVVNLQSVRDEVFGLKEINAIGKVVEHPWGYAIPKLLEVQLPKPGDFAEFKAQIEKDYIDSKAKELMQSEAKKLSETARKQGSLEKAAKEMGLSTQTSQPFGISGTPNPEIGANPSFNKVAFELQPGNVSEPLSLLDNEAVLQVKSRSPFDEAVFQKQKAELRAKLLQSSQDSYFQEYVRKVTEDLEKAGKIRINAKALENVSTASY